MLNLSSLSASFGLLSAIAMGTLVIGIAAWLFIRKQQRKIWLPILRIMRDESRKLPKLILAHPPWVSFITFVMAGLIWFVLSLFPSVWQVRHDSESQRKVHLFIDLSPSMSFQLPLKVLIEKASAIMGSLAEKSKATYSTSHGAQVFEFQNTENFEDQLSKLNYHRAGVRIGSALREQLSQLQDTDLLIVMSDGDAHSWRDFHWNFLTEKTEVRWFNPQTDEGARDNIFIDDVSMAESHTRYVMEWEVSLRRLHADRVASGEVSVNLDKQVLAKKTWSFKRDDHQLSLKISWNTDSKPLDQLFTKGSESFVVRLRTDDPDSVIYDNSFRVMAPKQRRTGLLIAKPTGERMLDDGPHHLQSILRVLNVDMERKDFIRQPGPKPFEVPFWLIFVNDQQDVAANCPLSFERERLSSVGNRAQKASVANAPHVWLIPGTTKPDYQSLCLCYARLMTSKVIDEIPKYCTEVSSRSDWIQLLGSVGGKQIGGDIDQADGAIAFRQRHGGSGISVTALTLPLIPSRGTGLHFGKLPLLVKSLLAVEFGAEQSAALSDQVWPRLDDIGMIPKGPQQNKQRVELSNVPFGESILQKQSLDLMPPSWSVTNSDASQLKTTQRISDEMPFVRWSALLLAALMGIEVLWLLIRQLRIWLSVASVGLFLIFGVFSESGIAQSKIVLNTTSYAAVRGSLAKLAGEVSARTSMELKKTLQKNINVDDRALREGWLWVSQLSEIANGRGQLRPDVERWMRRGGMLILEGAHSDQELNSLTARLENSNQGGRWQTIPPDHELMRSFYLLDSLPLCDQRVWKGFHQDGRLMMLSIPGSLLANLVDSDNTVGCFSGLDWERKSRLFVNILMVTLTTDYKKDQIHLPEILKRLR